MNKTFFFLLFISISCFSQTQNSISSKIKYSDTEINNVGYISIPIDRQIDQSTFIHAKLALEDFRKKGAIFVLLDLNTPGGQVFAAQKISSLLREIDLQYDIPVVAFVNNWAVSAGAMLAYACRYIAVTPFSIMGAAEPVISNGSEMKQASEKVNSALRAEFMNLASTYNRNQDIAEAMVDKDVILVYRNNRIVKLQNENQIKQSDEIISNNGKLLTLNSEALRKYGVADIFVPAQKKASLTDRNEDQLAIEKSLLFQQDFFKKIPNVQIITYKDWKTGFFSFLSHPVVSSLLLMGMLIGFYLEINTPGFGVFGGIALGCFSLVLLNSLAVQAVNWLEIIMLISGIALIILELFVIPGFGVVGILGIILTVIGLFALMVPNIQDITFNPDKVTLTAISAFHKLAWLIASVLAASIVIFFLWKYLFPRFGFFHHIVLKGEQEGYVSGISKEMLPNVGDTGVASTPLKPAGKALLNEKVYDVSSERNFIDKGEKIKVVRIVGNRILVRKI